MKSFLSAFIFIGMFSLGFGLLNFAGWQGSSPSRDPAAAYGKFDLSSLSGESLSAAMRERLLKGMEIFKDEKSLTVEIGNFMFSDSAGTKKFACEAYEKISVVFMAEGVSVAGYKPTMTVVGNCQNNAEIARIIPFKIPLEALSMQTPGDGEFTVGEELAVSVYLKNMPEHWPKLWVLQKIDLIKPNSADYFSIHQADVSQILGRPFVVTFE